MILTNAALTGLAFTWGFVAIAQWMRRRRGRHLVGACTMALISIIFFLRTLNVGAVAVPWAGDAIRILWLLALVTALIYSIIFVWENQLLRKPPSGGNNVG